MQGLTTDPQLNGTQVRIVERSDERPDRWIVADLADPAGKRYRVAEHQLRSTVETTASASASAPATVPASELFTEAMRMPRKRPPEEGEEMPKAKFQAVEESDDEGAAGGASSAAAGGASSAAGSGDAGEMHHILKQLGVEGMDIMYLDDLSANGFAEVYSCPRTAAIAPEHRLKQGWSLDRLTGWDLSCPRQRDRARQLFRQTRPKLLIGSPMCTFFSSLMDLNWKRMGKEKSRRCWREAVGHLEFCVEPYKEQMAAGRLFLHEHPLGASSWQVDAMAKLIEEPGVVKGDCPPMHAWATHARAGWRATARQEGHWIPHQLPPHRRQAACEV